MKGPHGLNAIRLYQQFPEGYLAPPFCLEVTNVVCSEGLCTGSVRVRAAPTSAYKRWPEVLACAELVYVEGDDETRDAATAWLLDLCNLRYGGGG